MQWPDSATSAVTSRLQQRGRAASHRARSANSAGLGHHLAQPGRLVIGDRRHDARPDAGHSRSGAEFVAQRVDGEP
jgi:hypothetical protein